MRGHGGWGNGGGRREFSAQREKVAEEAQLPQPESVLLGSGPAQPRGEKFPMTLRFPRTLDWVTWSSQRGRR